MSGIVVFLAGTKFAVALAAAAGDLMAARSAKARGVTSSFENEAS